MYQVNKHLLQFDLQSEIVLEYADWT